MQKNIASKHFILNDYLCLEEYNAWFTGIGINSIFCYNFLDKKCEFITNPDPMPQVVMKTVRQGNMMMQTQVKNEERVQKFCPSCCCWDKNHGCMKEFNIGCINKQDFWTSRNPS